MKALILILFTLSSPVLAQERSPATQSPLATAANLLAELKDEVRRVLADARLPFTDEQERAIVLMMEDRRQASEELFGNLMDFRAGPTQGQENDRLRSAIEWMREDGNGPEHLPICARNRFKHGGALCQCCDGVI